ncbi:DMT family transporter [Arenibaculum pallidiluteum]|uniref:DMT family transporter n=1 Tax=Arenibaculum pallidiluteum TaxID=2812559 RepID=UPI001A96CCD7|nr:DMT family transporter [Arenibaculum pallidiluteum]
MAECLLLDPASRQTESRRLEPLLLLLAVGGLIGATFPAAKLAAAAGVAPLGWAYGMLLGAGATLSALSLATGAPRPRTGRLLRYSAASGLLTMALPNMILFAAVPRLGAGLASVVYTLPPLLTLLMAAAIGLERPGPRRLLGIGIGFAGAALIVLPRGALPSPDLLGWMALALAIPVSVAAGNVYRTLRWPAGSSPLTLAAGTMLAGAAWVAVAALAGGWPPLVLGSALATPWLLAAQVAASTLQAVLFFRLQSVAGPVYLSQIGYVATACGLASGALAFGETYSPWVWAGAAVIAAGVMIVNGRARSTRRPSPSAMPAQGARPAP